LKHIEHVEDLILDDLTFSKNNIVPSLNDALFFPEKHLSVKYDGAPAIVAGIDPRNNKFFVASKSIYNKTPKYNYTVKDIRRNHPNSAGLIEILECCLKYLKGSIKTGMYHGDLMYIDDQYKHDLFEIDYKDGFYLCFKPNTITYGVDIQSYSAIKIAGSKIGIAWHTTCKGTPDNIETVPGVNKENFNQTNDVYQFFSEYKRKEDYKLNSALVFHYCQELHDLNLLIDDLKCYEQEHKEMVELKINALFRQYINMKIRNSCEMKETTDVVMFKEFCKEKNSNNKIIEFIEKNKFFFIELFKVYYNIIVIKNHIIDNLNQNILNDLNTFYEYTLYEYTSCNPEGYVYNNADIPIKLVNREEFSKRNFSNMKFRS
jgi:hypothetical protein